MSRQQSRITTDATFGMATLGQRMVAISAAAFEMLMIAGFVAPLALEAGGALAASGTATAATELVAGEIALAAGALRAAGTSTWVFYLENAVAVNEIGLFTVGTIISVEGDVPGLCRRRRRPDRSSELFAEIWILKTNIQTASGRTYRSDVRARPLPPRRQTDLNRLKLRVVRSPELEPVPPPSGRQAGPQSPRDARRTSRNVIPARERVISVKPPRSPVGIGLPRNRWTWFG